MSEKMVDLHFSARKKIDAVRNRILSLAYSFRDTGNEKMYDELCFLAEDIETGGNEFEQAYQMVFDNMVKTTQEGAANMISAALAVATRK